MPSAYGKGGIPRIYHYYNFAAIGLMAIVFTLPLRQLSWTQKIWFSAMASVLGVIISFLVTEAIVEMVYGYDYEMHINDDIANLIFYSLAFVCAALPLSAVSWMNESA